MSPPEVWGPAIWRLFHTLIEKLNERAYPYLSSQLFTFIFKICKFLPCPECSKDATKFLGRIKIQDLKTKNDFKNMLYLFHNYVNVKKRRPLFNYGNINVYKNYKLIPVFNNFIIHYNTKGNMKLLTESFQRQFVIKDFKQWLIKNIEAFSPQPVTVSNPVYEPIVEPVVVESVVEESVAETGIELVTKTIMEEPVVEEPVLEEPVLEESVLEEPTIEEPVLEEPTIEESVLEDHVVEESVLEESVVEESLVEESLVEESVTKDDSLSDSSDSKSDNETTIEISESLEQKEENIVGISYNDVMLDSEIKAVSKKNKKKNKNKK